MKTMSREVYEAACRITCDGKVPKKLELEAVDKRFIGRWYASNETDFGIYSDPEYIKTLLYCWSCTSGPHVNLCMKHGLIDPKTALDFHGGIGMTAILLARQFPNATIFNHSAVKEHRDICDELAKHFRLTNVVCVEEPVEAELFLAQETFEHIKDPFNEMRNLLDNVVKPKQYLDGTSFTIPGPGHFTNSGYLDGDVVVPHKSAKRRLTKVLRERGYRHYPEVRNLPKLFNGHPWLWEKTDK